VVPPAPPRAAGRGRAGMLVALLVLAVAGAAVAARAVPTRRVAATGHPADAAPPGRPAADATAPGAAGPPGAGTPGRTPADPGPPGGTGPSGSAPPAAGPAIAPIPPAGYTLHHEPGAYWVSIPAGWSADSDHPGEREWFGPPRPGLNDLLFVTVEVSTTAAASARDVLIARERGRRADRAYVFYSRVRLVDRPRLPGAASVADLEFTDRTWSDGAQTWHNHTMVRAVLLPGHRIRTVELSILHDIYNDPGSTEQDWQRATPVVTRILGSFRPDG
jgi:hypothetical protein